MERFHLFCIVILMTIVVQVVEHVRANGDVPGLGEEEDDFYDYRDEEPSLRWSMFLPRFVENWCYNKCRNNGLPFSRLVGVRCQCLCPVNAPDYSLCPPSGGMTSCWNFCQRNAGFRKGGDCMYRNNCFCFCRRRDSYNASIIYTTPSSTD